MVGQFTAAAEMVGAIVKRFSTVVETRAYLADLASGGEVTCSLLPEPIAGELAPLVGMGNPAEATLCVSRAEAGIAATGTLLIDLRSPDGRAATALAPKHAVILDPATIVPSLYDLGDRLRDLLESDQAYFSLTTGPSRTADIERVLTIGVHGPKELHILLVEGAGHE